MSRFQDATIPGQYKENSPKEKCVFEHVTQFKRQFQYQFYYDDKCDLFLFPKNECDVNKFICTTFRSTKLGFLELYDFFSDQNIYQSLCNMKNLILMNSLSYTITYLCCKLVKR